MGMSSSETVESILVVEDEAAQARVLKATLATFGYQNVTVSLSAEEALAFAEQHRPVLAMVDIGLRGAVDGVEVSRRLRALDVRVIFVTGSADHANLERAMCTGPCAYLLKPVRSPELRAAVEIALRAPRGSAPHVMPEPDGLPSPLNLLSPREVEVLRLVAAGYTGKEIATTLGIAKPTVDTYRVRIAEKLHANGRAELIAMATRAGLLLVSSSRS
jgi:DNA-binding NarL/FixJ family response regulator